MCLKYNLRKFRLLGACILLIMVLNSFVLAQSSKSIWFKGKTEISATFGLQPGKQNDANVQFKHFVNQNIGLGADIMLTDMNANENVGFVITGLFEISLTNTEGIIPFLNGGFGISNRKYSVDGLTLKYPLGVLSLGGGFKIPFGDRMLGKIGFRYQAPVNLNLIPFFGSGELEIGRKSINVLVGLSYLL